MIENKDIVNIWNKFYRMLFMDVVNCLKDWLILVVYIFKMWFDVDLLMKDWDGFIVFYYCIEI